MTVKTTRMNTTEAAVYCGVSKYFLEEQRKNRLPPKWTQFVPNGSCYYEKEDLDKWLADCTPEVRSA